MPESCHNCGAELYEGQQFCRRCGAHLRGGPAGGEAPTQLFPAGAHTAPAPAVGTSPLGGGGRTDPVAQAQPTAYQPPLATFQRTSPLPAAQPAPRRRRGAWLVALLVVFVLGAGLASGAAYLWWRATRPSVIVRKTHAGHPTGVPAVPPPPAPENLGARIKEALKNSGVPLPIDESGAVVSGTETVLTQTYDLGSVSSFAIHAGRGSVTVTGGDGDRAVVKITKQGGSPQERAGARVLASKTDEGLRLMTAPVQSAAVSVSYEVSLPRDLGQLEITVDNGHVRVSGFDGSVAADVKAGEVEFRDVSGRVRSKLIKGNTKVFYTGEGREGAQEFSVVKGNIEAALPEGAGADLKAETLDGDIELDERLGLRVEKGPTGSHVAGRLGEGGEALLFKVTNGDVRLKK